MNEITITEPTAARIMQTAINEERAAELLDALLDGGSATVDPTGHLVIISANMLADLAAQLPDLDDEEEQLEPEVISVFEEFWADIVCPNGQWNLDQVKRELHDYHNCLTEVPKVYMEITRGLMSKPNYLADEVLRVHEDRCPVAHND